MNKYKYVYWIIIATLGTLLFFSIAKQGTLRREAGLQLLAYDDSLKRTRNSLYQEETTNNLLVLENTKYLAKLESSDAKIKDMQRIIKQAEKDNVKLQVALNVATNTILSYQDSIDAYIDSIVVINDTAYPIYSRKIDMFGKWITGKVTLGRKTFKIEQDIYNEYDATLGYKSNGWFKKSTPILTIVNHNPYTTTEKQTGLKVEDKRISPVKSFLVGTAIGALIMLIL